MMAAGLRTYFSFAAEWDNVRGAALLRNGSNPCDPLSAEAFLLSLLLPLSLFFSFSFLVNRFGKRAQGLIFFAIADFSEYLRFRGVFLKVGEGVGGVLNPHVPTPLSHLSGLISSFTLPLSGEECRREGGLSKYAPPPPPPPPPPM